MPDGAPLLAPAQVTLHSARRVVEVADAAPARPVSLEQLQPDGTLILRLPGCPFAGSTQLATLSGMPGVEEGTAGSLNGLYPVNPPRKGEHPKQPADLFRVKLLKAEAAAAAEAIEAAVEGGHVMVR